MMPVGNDLNPYKHLEYFESDTPEGLKAQLAQITLPFKILSMYPMGKKHIVWVNLTRPIIKEKILEEAKDGGRSKQTKGGGTVSRRPVSR